MRRFNHTERTVIDLSGMPKKSGAGELALVHCIRKFSTQPNSGPKRAYVSGGTAKQLQKRLFIVEKTASIEPCGMAVETSVQFFPIDPERHETIDMVLV